MSTPNNKIYYGNYSLDELLCMCNNNGIKSFENSDGKLIITLNNGREFVVYLQDSGSGGGCCYTAGDGINIEDYVISTDASLVETTHNIVVIGEVGGYHNGDVIPQGTPIQDILNTILRTTYDVTPVLPTVDISLQNVTAGETYEVGTFVREIVVNSIYTDGKFVGNDNYQYSINAICNPNMYFYQMSNYPENHSQSDTYSFNVDYIEEETYLFNTRVNYTQSNGHPVRSDSTPSHVSIPAGYTDRAETFVKGSYKYFYGYINTGDIDHFTFNVNTQQGLINMNLSEGFCENDGITTIETMQSGEHGKNSLILALPEKYKNIIYTENSFGASVDVENRWELQNTISYTNGNSTINYYVYILFSLLPLRYNNIKFTQEN